MGCVVAHLENFRANLRVLRREQNPKLKIAKMHYVYWYSIKHTSVFNGKSYKTAKTKNFGRIFFGRNRFLPPKDKDRRKRKLPASKGTLQIWKFLFDNLTVE